MARLGALVRTSRAPAGARRASAIHRAAILDFGSAPMGRHALAKLVSTLLVRQQLGQPRVVTWPVPSGQSLRPAKVQVGLPTTQVNVAAPSVAGAGLPPLRADAVHSASISAVYPPPERYARPERHQLIHVQLSALA